MRSMSRRKPLRDVSNAKATNIHKNISENDGGQAGDDSLDRLRLVHCDLSSLLRQIDGLVVQALQSTSNNGRKEIQQFAHVLSDMQTSLKPWVSRFKKAVLSQSMGPENKSKQPTEIETLDVSKESKIAVVEVESPEETKWESLVSPSPLVSWRLGCHMERGRQLFLLTPLPQKKAFSSKYKSLLGAIEKTPSDKVAHPVSLCETVGNLGNDLHLVDASAMPTPNMSLDIAVTEAAADNIQTDCASSENVTKTNCSMFIMTPSIKMSPPKSCILLEPVSAFSKKKSQFVYRSTPFPTGVHCFDESQDSESSSDQSSDGLKLKYPELYGINRGNMQKKMVAEDSPSWIASPPKTCVIMDPSDNCLPKKGDFPATIKTNQCEAVDLAEFTPMVKEPMSSFRMGKHPGENTLKKELWTRFEAASTHVICFNTTLLQNTTKKGFLDILDEASDA